MTDRERVRRTEQSARDDTANESARAYSIDQFAARNGICRDGVYKEIRAGRLRARKAGKRTLIFDVDEIAWRDSLPALELPAA